MASLNKVQIIGNLGRAPEVNYTQGGMAVCKFTVATTEKWKDKQSGEQKEQTEWHRVTVWGKQGENCGKYLDKGSSVYVEGRLQTSSYEKDGITRYSTDIIASDVKFMGGKQGSQQSTGYQNQNSGPGYQNQGGFQQPSQEREGWNNQSQDIPF